MELKRFKKLVDDFEKNIIVKGIESKRFSKSDTLSTKNCKLANHNFGRSLGDVIDTDFVLIIDYYGYLKRSRGFIDGIIDSKGDQLKEITTHVVHFASIKMEDIAAMTSDISVMLDFPRLKHEILVLRGFRKRSTT